MKELNAEELLIRAKTLKEGKNAPGYGDKKSFCRWYDIITLLDAGASTVTLNCEQIGREYVHEVRYKGHVFTAITERPLEVFNKYKG